MTDHLSQQLLESIWLPWLPLRDQRRDAIVSSNEARPAAGGQVA